MVDISKAAQERMTANKSVDRNGLDDAKHLLATLEATSELAEGKHWKASGKTSAQDHELFKKVYEVSDSHHDRLAEKMVGRWGTKAVDEADHAERTAKIVANMQSDHEDPVECLCYAEAAIQEAINDMCDALPSDARGMDNFLNDMADEHDDLQYFLRQRKGGGGELEEGDEED